MKPSSTAVAVLLGAMLTSCGGEEVDASVPDAASEAPSDVGSDESDASSSRSCETVDDSCVSGGGADCCPLWGYRVQIEESAGCVRRLDSDGASELICVLADSEVCQMPQMRTCYVMVGSNETGVLFLGGSLADLQSGESVVAYCDDETSQAALTLPECDS